MHFDVSTLPDDPGALKQILLNLQGDFSSLQERYNKDTGILLEQIRHLRGKLFGRTSEKYAKDSSVVPLPFFDMPEPEMDQEASSPVEEVAVPAHTRQKRGRKPLPEDLPRVEIVHDLPDEEKVCSCGQELSRMGEEVSEQLDIIPARVQVLRHIRPKYVCRACEGVASEGSVVKIASLPAQIIPKSIASPSVLACTLTGKFVDALPFYRQEKQFLRLGIKVSRTSMCNWAMKAAEACLPLYNLLQDTILSGKVVNVDETTVQVLAEPGRDPTTKSYMWVFRRGDPDKTVLIYQYHPTRSGDVAAAFLCDYHERV